MFVRDEQFINFSDIYFLLIVLRVFITYMYMHGRIQHTCMVEFNMSDRIYYFKILIKGLRKSLKSLALKSYSETAPHIIW